MEKVEKKVKPQPVHVGPGTPVPAKQEGDGVHNGVKTALDRAQGTVKLAAPIGLEKHFMPGHMEAQLTLTVVRLRAPTRSTSCVSKTTRRD